MNFLGATFGSSSTGPGPAASSWSLAERAKFPSGKPTAARIAEYFEPAVRGGKKLNMMEGNWCAAGACFAAMKVVGSEDLEKAGLPHAYRVSGKELEEDAIKHGAWLPVADVLKGARPNVGDLAIYNRGDPQDWTRHVGRVIEVNANSYKSIDGNGVGAAWWVADRLWTAENLRGFVRYPASLGSISAGMGIVAGMLMIAAGAAFVWGVTRVKPGLLRANPLGRGCLGRGCSLSPELVEKYVGLARAQRGAPERAMNDVQRAMGGGVLSFVVEHVGDLTHRMSERLDYGSAGYEYVRDKVEKTLRSLDSKYGFEREHAEQLASNARHYKIEPFEYKRRVDVALKRYAEAHAKLRVYNPAQWTARQVAVKLGTQEFKKARDALRGLKHQLDKGEESWWAYATAPPDPEVLKLGNAYLPWE